MPTLGWARHEDSRVAPRAALVMTLLLPEGGAVPLVSFVRWHLHVGFEALYLYFDDARAGVPTGWLALDAFRWDTRVIRARRSGALRAEHRAACASWNKFGAFETFEVQARQCLNAEHAGLVAHRRGIRWLTHLDADELFLATPEAFNSHFAGLDAAKVGHCTYANHEAIAEGADIYDYFAEITLFKVNHHVAPLSRAAAVALAWWRSRSLHGQYLLGYDCGKSSVRLVGGVRPASVHAWITPPGTRWLAAFEDPRVARPATVAYLEPCVLHYLTCGEFWLRTKYELLGDFSNAWFGGVLPIAPSYHLDARDAVAVQDATHLDAFYAAHLAPPATTELARHVAAGVLCREPGPSVLLCGRIPRALPRMAAPIVLDTRVPVRPCAGERAWVLAAATATFL
mmetsp:Transcript_20465/g.61018  ORF Transcript_20465/g.61018 Transcript_20465/m.61018 type:complete len:399 (+) Transcript_20465:215-1411(+)